MPEKQPVRVFDLQFTEAVSNILAQTDWPGLTSTELHSVLLVVRLNQLEPGSNKRKQLLATLHNAQVRRGDGRTLVGFVNAAMSPARYVHDPQRFNTLRAELNAVLVLYGLRVNEAGKLATGPAATTLSEAARLSGELVSELRRRGCHPTLLAYCTEELVSHSMFHAVSEAAKSIPTRVRRHTGLPGDGAQLYDSVFGSQKVPAAFRINPGATDSDDSEQRGFKNLLIGIHGHYRNPRAHKARLGAEEDLGDLYDAFSLFSYVHRRLDRAGFAA